MKPGRLSRELRDADLGDARRERRLPRVAAFMAQAPSLSVGAACGGWNEAMAAYRLLASPAVTPEKILKPHRRALCERAGSGGCVAVIQDTTELDFSAMKQMDGRGPLNDEGRRCLYLHSLYAVTEEGLPLGLWDMAFHTRSDAGFRNAGARKKRPFEEKESYRWLEGYRRTQALAEALPDHEVVSLADREGDLYEIFAVWAELRAAGGPLASWIIRAQQDRALRGLEAADAKAAPAPSLFATLSEGPPLGETRVEITRQIRRKKGKGTSPLETRSAREAVLEVRAMEVTLRPPFRKGGRRPAVTLGAVWISEVHPPEREEPVRWLLLTSLPARTLEEALRVVALYRRRWDIEVFHRVLKTGCRVEEIQLKGEGAVRNALAIYAITAWRILYLTHLGRVHPEQPCGQVFTAAEWKAACAVAGRSRGKSPPGDPPEPPLGEFILMVARFGGHLGRKSDGPPGAQVLWQGLNRLRDFACAWEAIHGA